MMNAGRDDARPNRLELLRSIPSQRKRVPDSTYAAVSRAAALWPSHTALSVLPRASQWTKPRHRSFAQLLTDVHRVANLLLAVGIRRTDAVALLSPNCDELITAILAAQTAGIAAPMPTGLSSNYLARHLCITKARVLVTAGPELDPSLWETVRQLLSHSMIDTVLLLRPTDALDYPPRVMPVRGVRVAYLSALAETQPCDCFLGAHPQSSELSTIFPTSGTTTIPKLVAHSHANQVAAAWMLTATSPLDERATIFAAKPLFQPAAVGVTLLAPLLHGDTVVWAGPLGYRDPSLAKVCWKIAETYGVNAMCAPPDVFSALSRIPVDADISQFCFGFTGAAPLAAPVRTEFEEHTGAELIEGYGTAEATCTAARSSPGESRPGSVGRLLPFLRAKTIRVDDNGDWQDLPTGQTGFLALHGPTIFPGYVTGHDGNSHTVDGLGALRDGWLNTGDVACLDPDGYIHLTGRSNDVIISGSEKIHPDAIEKTLRSHPAVRTAAVVGRPHPHIGETPSAYVSLYRGAIVPPGELHAWIADRIGRRHCVPREIIVLDTLPLTPCGELYRAPLRADATRRAITEALGDLPCPIVVDVYEIDGAITAEIIARGIDEADVKEALAGFTVSWRFAPRSL